MTFRLALRSLAAQPVRAAVLTVGFGVGVGAMAGLLGVGEVILEQSQARALSGGGDLVVHGLDGSLANARFLLSEVLASSPFAERVLVASPSLDAPLYLVEGGESVPLHARGGIPSLERALGDPETGGVGEWVDGPRDHAWTDPAPGEVLRAMDRFHPIPDVPARAESWAEWLYFNGRARGEPFVGRAAEETGFYLTFLVGPRVAPGRRSAGVRLQIEGSSGATSYSARDEIDEEMLRGPVLRIGRNEVRVEGRRYHIRLALFSDGKVSESGRAAFPDLEGELFLDAPPARALPPIEIHGAGGWVTGYVVPVPSGALAGSLSVDGRTVSFEGGSGYHDHNWGFWKGVRWRWGQVATAGLSIVYGRIEPPEDAADPVRVPGFLVALGPDGPLGFSTDVVIEETGPAEGLDPTEIRVRAQGETLQLTLVGRVIGILRNPLGGPLSGRGEFLQMRAHYRVSGRIGERAVEFEEPGAAETFRD